MPSRTPLARRLTLLIAVLLLGITSAAAQPSAKATSSGFKIYVPLVAAAPAPAVSIEQQVVELTNQHRRQNGCNIALTISPQLSAAAAAHSQDMALHDIFSHTGSDGSTMVSRIEGAGYAYSQIAENLSAGQATPQDVVAVWMSSSGHRANILDCTLRDIGIGYYHQPDDKSNVRLDDGRLTGPYRYYWTQDFGVRRTG